MIASPVVPLFSVVDGAIVGVVAVAVAEALGGDGDDDGKRAKFL